MMQSRRKKVSGMKVAGANMSLVNARGLQLVPILIYGSDTNFIADFFLKNTGRIVISIC